MSNENLVPDDIVKSLSIFGVKYKCFSYLDVLYDHVNRLHTIRADFANNGVTMDYFDEGTLSSSDNDDDNNNNNIHIKNNNVIVINNNGYSPERTSKAMESFFCVFCDNNKEPEEYVHTHNIRDRSGRTLCPKLRSYVCPTCSATGDKAHTRKYCPLKPIITMEEANRLQARKALKACF